MSALNLTKLSEIKHLLRAVYDLPIEKQRAVCAVVGAAVADAASRPMHWVYDKQILEDTV
jgi:hypothetical protein